MTPYEKDRFAWSVEQSALLRARSRSVDCGHVAEEIERLARLDEAMLRDRFRILLTALIRWAYKPDLRSVSLDSTIFTQRTEIDRLLEDSPSLLPFAKHLVVEAYPEARRAASLESGPFADEFSEGLPFLPEEVLNASFMPDPYGDDEKRGTDWWRSR